MAIIRTSKAEIIKYYENSAMNQSLLKKLNGGPQAFIAAQHEPERKLYYEEKGHFIIGGAVDCYITQGEEEFNTIYHKLDGTKKPKSEKIMSIIKCAFDRKLYEVAFDKLYSEEIAKLAEGEVMSPTMIISEDRIIEAMKAIVLTEDYFTSEEWSRKLHASCNVNEYYMNRAKAFEIDNRIETVKKDPAYMLYITALCECQGKQILSEDEWNIINGIIMSLTTHPYIKDYFRPVNENVDIIYQLPIYFTWYWKEYATIDGIELVANELPEREADAKALLDLVIIDHVARTIQPCDIKTTEGEPYWFRSKLISLDYHIQAAYYTRAILQWKENNSIINGKLGDKINLIDYTILPFKFIVESTRIPFQGQPLVFKCTNSLIELGLNGREKGVIPIFSGMEDMHTQIGFTTYHPIKGINQLFSDLEYYKQNGFNKRREIPEGNHFEIDYNDITPIEFVQLTNLNEE